MHAINLAKLQEDKFQKFINFKEYLDWPHLLFFAKSIFTFGYTFLAFIT